MADGRNLRGDITLKLYDIYMAAVAEQYGFEHPTWWVIVFIDGIL